MMLSDRQRQTYQYLCHYIQQHGVAPKLREIAQHLGIQSRGVVHRYLRALVDAELISIASEQARGIRLLQVDLDPSNGGLRLPLLGRIAAGQPIEAIAGQDHIDLSEFFVGPNRFVLRVQGDSMIEAGILDGDMVIIDQRQSAEKGDIVVALIDNDEATLKYLRQNSDGSVTLHPANQQLSPMRYAGERVQVQGVVVGQFRAYG